MLDLYTFQKEKGKIDGLTFAFLGDSLYSRTNHSLIRLLPYYKNVKVMLCSPKELELPQPYYDLMKKHKNPYSVHRNVDEILPKADVLIVTRVQKERFPSEQEYKKMQGTYRIDASSLKKMKKDAIITHVMPRVGEIAPEVDSDPRAAYFRQAQNGLYIRMALLEMLLK